MILVTGATGAVGREVAGLLAAAGPVRILARRPERLTVRGDGVEVVEGAYGDRPALDRALEGVSSVFLVTNSPTDPDDERVAGAAAAAGVRHLVKLSMMAVEEPGADDFITRWQRRNEETIRASGVPWTFVRPRTFMSNTLSWAPGIRSAGVVRALYGDAPVACVDPRDVAAVAVAVLTGEGHEGRTYAVSGPEAITAREQTAQLSRVLGRPLRFEELGLDAARTALLAKYPRPAAEAFLESAERQRAGAKAAVVPTVEELTGCQARPYRTWAADHADAFAAE
ncbi:NmrA family NAD(P)-binding protein [Streptomyces rubiginosohelvolus]|uniref:NmrA family NAD(P)-binding protein n=1 Tax=Streptomyces TaxID=1883 RepID=UPI00190AA528|nr:MULTISPECIES: NAD(P)H-binding protein [unclassified Streptomyces]MBK3532317.1 NAD(P)H-binding protein [Streptomyces sp. MBT72]MBK3538085.1 NAD(P)H-binding protein [Streptomyces sp. MBT67]MBK3542219.1 NAD(P)H-binding protein [Streptomyces sp. MBT60]MBK3550725.1 NAD(P)H-binding protein [Streptomyces sp. MBT61]MBK6029397.1 NAD(P)H-binding protein [Streptomyces sp. MBT59]